MFKSIVRTSVAAIVLAVVVGVALQQFGLLSTVPNPSAAVVTIQVSPVILQEVKRVNKQIFVEHYGSVDIDYTQVPQGWLSALKNIGIQQHYVILLRGRVPAGFDLQQLSEGDIWVSPDGKRAQVTLPPPKIFEENVSIDYANTRMLAADDKCPNFLCTEDLRSYNDTILPEGQKRLIEAAGKNEILRQTAIEGKLYYERLLNQLGIGEVRVVVKGYDL